ncbi:hypothetical protein VS868_11705 [Salinimicrobium sp. 3283s]|uniref:hypothetical protein n=1 Tax=Salinimicrobium sp. 3283s TaxID=3114359 RepID=UPI0031EE478D
MNSSTSKFCLIAITIGIWAIVLQNAGVISTQQDVYVNGGSLNADVSGSVQIDETIDVNIHEINGHRNAFYEDHDGDYMVLPVVNR